MSRYDGHYLPASMVSRTGIAIKDLDSSQKPKLYDLMKDYLSEKGYKRSADIINYEYLLKELEPNNPNRIPESYYIAIYGNLGTDSIWGWKFSGHHLALNFTIVNDHLAFDPFFFGLSPANPTQGPNKGKRIIKDEEDLAFQLINSLTPPQKTKAIFQLKPFTDIVTTNLIEVTH